MLHSACYFHFTSEKTEAQRSSFDFDISHNQRVAKPGFRVCPLASHPTGLYPAAAFREEMFGCLVPF